jgi:hypothetical protein
MTIDVRLYPTNPHQPPRPPQQVFGANDTWDTAPKSRVVEIALAAAAIAYTPMGSVPTAFVANAWTVEWAGPATVHRPFPATLQLVSGDTWIGTVPTAFVANAWTVFWDGPPRASFSVKLQQVTPWLPQGDLTSTPQGWPFTWPERFTKKFPASAQHVTGDTWIGTVPTAFVANAWVVAWDGPATIRKPVAASLQLFTGDVWIGTVPTAFVANAWVAYWDGPARGRFPASAQQVAPWLPQGDLVSTPQGWPVFQWPDRFARPFPAPAQIVTGDVWIGSVPTAFAGNAWVVAWDGPARARYPVKAQQFDLPVLAVYAANVVTFPEGWQIAAPDARASPQRGGGFEIVLTPTQAVPQGWWTVFADPRKGLALQAGQEIVPVTATAQVFGATAVFADPIRVRVIARGSDGAPEQQGTVTANAYLAGWEARPRTARGPASEVIWPAQAVTAQTGLGNTALWDSVSHRFRTITPPPPDFARLVRVFQRIASQPTLTGVSTNPTLTGVSTSPLLSGVSAKPTLLGVSTNPTLLGVSTNPKLLGKV